MSKLKFEIVIISYYFKVIYLNRYNALVFQESVDIDLS